MPLLSPPIYCSRHTFSFILGLSAPSSGEFHFRLGSIRRRLWQYSNTVQQYQLFVEIRKSQGKDEKSVAVVGVPGTTVGWGVDLAVGADDVGNSFGASVGVAVLGTHFPSFGPAG
uniref:Uncharacterized protein n=1 Tax=Pseudictyota dubia TaxID=2749911 RepID=A0A7R9W7H3_9STRA|mmetsp:Transcript_35451/g.65129  ORF Transcript_35451/g.65129 Transcript_35451/m.65129 type:complete len:115 (+) Transcript_35451:97-441(+)